MKREDEKLFFEHDIAGPLTNMHGAAYLLKMGSGASDKGSAEALGILDSNLHSMERMLGWYWRTRELPSELAPVEPWPARDLPAAVRERLQAARLSLAGPAGEPGEGSVGVPQETLVVALLGAALTLAAASGAQPEWTMEAARGVLIVSYVVPGDEEALDAGRLFRKLYWPSKSPPEAWVDPGIPYLKAVLQHFNGSVDLAWREGTWTLECSLPLIP